MTKLSVLKTTIILVVVCIIGFSLGRVYKLNKVCNTLQNNQTVLLTRNNELLAEKQKYKVSDSLNAIKVNELRLTLDEYKKYRADDLALINKLNIDKREMQKIINLQAENINRLSVPSHDTLIVYKDTLAQVKAFSYNSQWTDISGLINLQSEQVDLSIKNRESLVIVESVKYKRFLGFLWKTKNIKSRSVDIVSRNPNTEIIGAEYESIEALK